MSHQEIVWTHPGDGRTWITIPADNVYVPVDVVGQPAREDFVTLDAGILGVTEDAWHPDPDGNEGKIFRATHRKATIEEIAANDVKELCLNDGFDVVEYHIVDRSISMGMDGYFRDAWEHDFGIMKVNMDKAVVVHKNKLREARAYLLADLDIAQSRKLMAGDLEGAKALEPRKQELRDITKHPSIAAAKTLDELKASAIATLME